MKTRKNPKAWVIVAALVLLLGGMGQYHASGTSMMYWTDLSTKKIQRANLDGSGVTDLITMGLRTLHDIALDTAGGKMYWTDSGLDSIQRANLNGSHIEALVTTGLSAPIGIALDVDAGKMYWTDSLTHKIQRANLNGSGVEDLITTGLQWPRAIALDVAGGKMYWVDAGTVKIQRANLDGSGVEDLITIGFGLGYLKGIALDVTAGKMYWIYWPDVLNRRIQRANLDGSDGEVLVTTDGNLRGIALDVGAGKMYWTDTLFDKIQCANLDGSSVQDLVTTGLDYPIGIALDVPKPPKIIYIDGDASGANNGSSWADAYNYLQDGLVEATSGDEIRVAQGVYKPAGPAPPSPPPPPPPLSPSSPPPPPPPPPTADRTATFQLKNGVAIKGGYAGSGEPDPNARDIEAYETILSGDLNGNDIDIANPEDFLDEPTRAENSYHVVTGSGTNETAVLDGFTITAGNANSSYPRDRAGGVYNDSGSPIVTNCTFSGNSASYSGGGMFNIYSSPVLANCIFKRNSAYYGGGGMTNSSSSPTVTNCTFSANTASRFLGDGGGMYNYKGTPTVMGCIFSGNSARDGGGIYNRESSLTMANCMFSRNSADDDGGGMENYRSSPTLINCNFIENWAENSGGGLYNYKSSPTVTSCTFSGNSADSGGGGICNYDSRPMLTNCTFARNSAYNGNALACESYVPPYPSNVQITNCILWDGGGEIWNNDNSIITITYSDVQGGWPGEGNINADPLFVDAANDDYHLLPGSLCINAGDPDYIAEPNETDLDGRPRIIGGRIDMGAYEFNHIPVADAGPDQTVYTGIDGIAEVTLDGTNSYDDDGQMLTYLWSWTIDDEIITTITTTGSDGIVNMLDFAVLSKQWLRTGNSLADIAPLGGDGLVDILDLSILTQAWLTTPASPNWNPQCDIAPTGATPTIELPCGVYSIELIVNDGIVDSEPDYVEITVLDGTPPVITCPSDVALECPADTSTAATGSATATDNCDDSPAIVYSDLISGTCPEVIVRTWTATDECGNSSTCVQTLTVVDTTPPEIEVTVPPVDAALQDGVTLTAASSDTCGDVTEVYFYVREPGGTNGIPIGYEDLTGTLNTTSGKWEYPFDTTLLLDGYYVILAKAIDTCGNEGWSEVVPFSIRNWAVLELLPASVSNKAGRTMPVKFSLRIAESVDPAQPFVYNEGLEIRIYDAADQTNILQTSLYGDTSRDYRIDSARELYITNFKTKSQPAEYVVEIWRTSKNFLVGSFTFETVK